MGVTINGNSITLTNVTLELVNGYSEETGVAYLIITPEGGVGSLPVTAPGSSGMPTLFPKMSVIQHPHGEVLPNPNPVQTLLDSGGPGLPAKYALEFHINQPPAASPAAGSLASLFDFDDSGLGALTEGFLPAFRASDGMWVPRAPKVGSLHAAPTIAATAFNNTNPRLLSAITVPPQPFDWRPKVYAQTVISGSGDTQVDLVARLNDQASGDEVGRGKGPVGPNIGGIIGGAGIKIPTVLFPSFPTGQLVAGGTYAKVLKDQPATVYLRAEQRASTSGAWSTPAAPDTVFTVEVQPII